MKNDAIQLAWCSACDGDGGTHNGGNSFAEEVCESITGTGSPSHPIVLSSSFYLSYSDDITAKMAFLEASRPDLVEVDELSVSLVEHVTTRYGNIVDVALRLLSRQDGAGDSSDSSSLLLLRASLKQNLSLFASGIETFVNTASEINVRVSSTHNEKVRTANATAALACLLSVVLYCGIFVSIMRASRERFRAAEREEIQKKGRLRDQELAAGAKTEAVEMTLAQICHEVRKDRSTMRL